MLGKPARGFILAFGGELFSKWFWTPTPRSCRTSWRRRASSRPTTPPWRWRRAERGGALLLTWAASAEAVRAKAALHDFVWADSGVRVNAKFFAPPNYDPWQDDERFASVRR